MLVINIKILLVFNETLFWWFPPYRIQTTNDSYVTNLQSLFNVGLIEQGMYYVGIRANDKFFSSPKLKAMEGVLVAENYIKRKAPLISADRKVNGKLYSYLVHTSFFLLIIFTFTLDRESL